MLFLVNQQDVIAMCTVVYYQKKFEVQIIRATYIICNYCLCFSERRHYRQN